MSIYKSASHGYGPLRKKTSVILFNLGGPLSEKGIYPFLFSLFYDPAILTLPNPFRYVLASLIARLRLPKARDIYAHLGGRSPLLQNTVAQALALEKKLGKDFRVFVVMRHAPPFASEVLKEVRAYEPDEVVLLPLYPHYSSTTTESSLKDWKRASRGWAVPTRVVASYPIQEDFLKALQDLMRPFYEKAKAYGRPQVLLTAHGLPEKTIKKGDPYQRHVEQTVEKLSLPEAILCYQSRVGPLKWIGPSLEEEILKASRCGRPLVVVPLSFVSEHSETLVELDITLRDLALREGCPAYERVPTLQTHPLFIKALASLVQLALDENVWYESEGRVDNAC